MSRLPELTTDPKTGKPLLRDAVGRHCNLAAWRRAQYAQRAEIIALLGLSAEGTTPDDHYCASTHELWDELVTTQPGTSKLRF
jgi:hypothetical protein